MAAVCWGWQAIKRRISIATKIVFVSYPEGKFSPVTRDTNNYSALSLAADGHVLATVLNEDRWNLSVMPAAAEGPLRTLTSTGATTNSPGRGPIS